MASFTDDPRLVKFNPYIQEVPTEALATVGLFKQGQYQQGLEKVQGYMDNLLSLSIAMPEAQEYVKAKVSQMRDSLAKNTNGDFSDQRLLAQVGGLASRISKDPIVQNAVNSTSSYKKVFADIEEARKSGKSSPQNEQYALTKASEWMNSGDITRTFSDSYTPYTDKMKIFLDYYSKMHPGENIDEDAFRYDENGNITINPTMRDGIDADRIASVWKLVSSLPEVQQQNFIDGWYKYRGMTSDDMYQSLNTGMSDFMETTNSTIEKLKVKAATDKSANVVAIANQIETLQKLAEQKKERYQSQVELLGNNPDVFKQRDVEDDMLHNLVGAFAYEVMKKSPLFDADMEMKKLNLDLEEFELNKLKFAQDVKMDDWQIQKDKMELEIKKNKMDEESQGKSSAPGVIVTSTPVTDKQGELGATTMYQSRDDARGAFSQSFRSAVYDVATESGVIPPFIKDPVSGAWSYNVGKGKDQYPDERTAKLKADQLYLDMGAAAQTGSISPNLKEKYREVGKQFDNWLLRDNIIKEGEKLFQPGLDEVRKTIGNEEFALAYMVENKLPGWEAAKKTLVSRYGDNWGIGMGIIGTFMGKEGQVYKPGSREMAYKKASAKVSQNKNLPLILEDREKWFRDRQQALMSPTVNYNPVDEKQRSDIVTKFRSLANMAQSVSDGKSKGIANEILKQLESEKDAENLHFTSGFDWSTGKAWIAVKKGDGDTKRLDLPSEAYFEVFPEQKVDNTFDREYGDRLDISRGINTYLPGAQPKASAYMADLPDNSNYSVKYHVLKSSDGKYKIQAWIDPKPTPENSQPKPILNGDVLAFPGAPATLNKQGILEAVKMLSNPNFVETYVQYLKPNGR